MEVTVFKQVKKSRHTFSDTLSPFIIQYKIVWNLKWPHSISFFAALILSLIAFLSFGLNFIASSHALITSS